MNIKKSTRELWQGERIIYLATRLFDLSEKISSAKLEEAVFEGVMSGFNVLGIQQSSSYPIFMPYRDTCEDELHHSKDLFTEIYQNDLVRLNKLYAMIGYINDPSKDDGVCMEFGFAFGRQAPIIAFITDIQKYAFRSQAEIDFLVDPVLSRMIGKLYYYPNIEPSKSRPSTKIEEMLNFALEYKERLYISEQTVLSQAKMAAKEVVMSPENYISLIPTFTPMHGIFIDFIGQRDEWCREYSQRLRSELDRLNLGIPIKIGCRYHPEFLNTFYDKDFNAIGEYEIKQLLESSLVIICADGAEVDAGSAALLGLAKATEKHIILYYSGNIEILEGKARCYRNLMLQYSSNSIASSLDEIVSHVKSLY